MTLLKSIALTLVASVLLWSQIAFATQGGIQNLPGSSWRFWDDMTLAIARYVDTPKDPYEREDGDLLDLVGPFQEMVEDKVANTEIQPHQFWRTVNDAKFRRNLAPFSQKKNEDPGRSLVLLLGFRVLGGVAPYLLLWLGALALLPALFWILYEFVSAGLTTAGMILAGLIAFSPYWFECLALPHSAMGFYLSALVALAAFSLAAFMPRPGGPLGWRPLAARAVCLTAILIVAIWCRSGAVFFVPAAFIAATLGFSRGGLSRRGALALAASLVLLPAAVLRPHQVHNIWLSFWEGLGDFGTDHGYSWYDADAGKFLAKHGIPGRTELRYVSAREEAIFKDAFVSDLLSSPVWYGSVLLRRMGAILAFTHLSPYGPRDGESRRTPLFHYKYTTPIDWFGWKERIREVPVSTLYLPTLLLLIWGALAGGRIRGEIAVLSTIGVAALPVPLLISTASGLETQAFGLVYFLGAAFLVQRAADVLASRLQHA